MPCVSSRDNMCATHCKTLHKCYLVKLHTVWQVAGSTVSCRRRELLHVQHQLGTLSLCLEVALSQERMSLRWSTIEIVRTQGLPWDVVNYYERFITTLSNFRVLPTRPVIVGRIRNKPKRPDLGYRPTHCGGLVSGIYWRAQVSSRRFKSE